MPSWLLGKTAGIIGVGVVVLAVALGMLRSHDNRIRREAVADTVAKVLKTATKKQVDTLVVEKLRTDTIVRTVRVATAGYATQRARVDTITRNVNIPVGHVVVPIEYVRSADSLAVVVQTLLATVARERIASDSVIALQRLQIAQLEIQVKDARPKFTQKMTYAGIGAGVVAVAYVVFGRRD